MAPRGLEDRVKELTQRRPNTGRDYFAFTILADDQGDVRWSSYSRPAGWADPGGQIELRAASLVRADTLVRFWTDIGESFVVVDEAGDMVIFLLLGGNALVERRVAESFTPEFIKPQPVAQNGLGGLEHMESLPKSSFNKVPTQAERVRILKRDGFRCRVCGRWPADDADLELHVHHLRPWARGGVTDDANLISLCQTCHNGPDPHQERRLFDLLAPSRRTVDVVQSRKDYWDGVRRYREKIVRDYSARAWPSE